MADKDDSQEGGAQSTGKATLSEAQAASCLPERRQPLVDLLLGAGTKERGTCCNFRFEDLSLDECLERLSK